MNHKRVTILLIFFILIGTTPSFAKSTLWVTKIADHQLYLMGSIHVLRAQDYPLPATMESAYQQSDIIVFEIDQQEMRSKTVQRLLLRLATYPPTTNLGEHLTEQTLNDFKGYLRSMQLPYALFQHFKPAYCALIITLMEFEHLGFLPQYGLDEYFAAKARKDGKKILALETVAFQLNLFFQQNAISENAFLAQTLTEINTLPTLANGLEKAWVHGLSKELHKLLSDSFQEYPKFYKLLITDRNRDWVPKILEIMTTNKKNILVVVGAGHLVGPAGVVRLLTEQGYTFQQL